MRMGALTPVLGGDRMRIGAFIAVLVGDLIRIGAFKPVRTMFVVAGLSVKRRVAPGRVPRGDVNVMRLGLRVRRVALLDGAADKCVIVDGRLVVITRFGEVYYKQMTCMPTSLNPAVKANSCKCIL